ncbi:unnamed protein product [Schistocephalus solidus]|uniref:Dolichyl-diphosphooligosaccharide--protein glycosyltransferase subunit 2 n=1 Tax=Schistocephalus solidus TaxID=70667 RepID=A0A183T1L1_SCHSO|nr:unnamed protein product [Schistocephalus solidus]
MILFKLLALTLLGRLALAVTGQPLALPIGHLTATDKEHIKHVLTESLDDVKSAHFAALGYQSLGEKFDAVAKVCPLFQASANSEDIDLLYHAVSGASILGATACKVRAMAPDREQNSAREVGNERHAQTTPVVFHGWTEISLVGPRPTVTYRLKPSEKDNIEDLRSHFDDAYVAVQVPNFGQFMKKKLNSALSSDELLSLLSTAKILNETGTPNMQKLLHSIVDSSTINDLIKQLKKKDNSAMNLANILLILTSLKLEKSVLETFLPEVKTLLNQADEADGIYLYYDKGVYTTSLAIDGIFKMAAALGKPPAISEQQVIKFANFLYSKRRTQHPRSAAYLLVAMRTLSSNAFMFSASVSLDANYPARLQVTDNGTAFNEDYVSNEAVRTRCNNIVRISQFIHERRLGWFGHVLRRPPRELSSALDPAPLPLGGVEKEVPIVVTGASAHERAAVSGLTISSKRQVSIRLATLLGETHLTDSTKIDLTAAGLYHLPSSASAEPTLLGPSSRGAFKSSTDGLFTLDLVTKDGAIPYGHYALEITAKPKKGTSPLLVGVTRSQIPVRVLYMVRVTNAQLSLATSDSSSGRVDIPLSDSVSGESVHPHQVFIQLTHDKTRQSITYICEKTSSVGGYSFKLIPDNVASDFDYLYGIYSMDLIVGDALLTNALVWRIADLDVHLPIDDSSLRGLREPDIAQQSVASASSRKRSQQSPLIGRGPSKAKPELEHTFISIFALYLWYWIELNMFTTLRYLLVIGLVTLFAGNRLLRHMNSVRNSDMASPSKPNN